MSKKMTFALAFCNRGFMPGELIYGARDDMIKAVTDAGYNYIAMDASLTRYGGIETRDEGLLYAKWLKQHEGEYDGVIFSMPIFADENGAITALERWTSSIGVTLFAASSPSRTFLLNTAFLSPCSSPMSFTLSLRNFRKTCVISRLFAVLSMA